MKIMIRAKSILLTVSLALVGMVPFTAQAIPINITVDASGALFNSIGVADSAQYELLAGSHNNNPTDNKAFLDALIANWNGVPLSPVLPASGSLALDQPDLGSATQYSGSAGYEYVVIHWGAGNAGGGGVSQGGWWSAYHVGGEAISFVAVPQIGGQNVGGFSSARYFGRVPDGGMTLSLLGMALAGLGVLRRKLSV